MTENRPSKPDEEIDKLYDRLAGISPTATPILSKEPAEAKRRSTGFTRAEAIFFYAMGSGYAVLVAGVVISVVKDHSARAATPTPNPRGYTDEDVRRSGEYNQRAATATAAAIPVPFWINAASDSALRLLSEGDRVKILAATGSSLTSKVTAVEAAEWLRVNQAAEKILKAQLNPQRVERINLGWHRDVTSRPWVNPLYRYPLGALPFGSNNELRIYLTDAAQANPWSVHNGVHSDYRTTYEASFDPSQRGELYTSIHGATYFDEISGVKRTDINLQLVIDPVTGEIKESLTELSAVPLFKELMGRVPNPNLLDPKQLFQNSPAEVRRAIMLNLQSEMVNLTAGNNSLGTVSVSSDSYNRPDTINIHQRFK